MDSVAFQYFQDLKANGVVERIRKTPKTKDGITIVETNGYVLSKCKIDGDPTNQYYIKKSDTHRSVVSSATADMYGKAGILTPPVYLIRASKANQFDTLQQDVCSLWDIDAVLACAVKGYDSLKEKAYGRFKWQIFYNTALRDYFLKFMTPGCFNQLKNMFLASEVRTDIDGHLKNYFFYKKPGDIKFSGVIPIDLEEMTIFDHRCQCKQDFENFIYLPYYTETPQQNNDYLCYKDRVRDIRELIQDGVMNEDNAETLRVMLSYDFPGEIKKKCNDHLIIGKERRKAIDPIERLWEYNRQTIGRDLGL